MKKLLIVLALVLAVSVIFVSCRDEEVVEPDGGEGTTTTVAGEDGTTTAGDGNEDSTTTAAGGDLDDDETTAGEGNTTAGGEDNTTAGGEDNTTAGGEDNTTAGGEDNTTEGGDPAPVETIPYIGRIGSINGLGPNGLKETASNTYSTLCPNTLNPNVAYYPPASGGYLDYYCRSFTVSGWAILEGGQGELVWSDDYGTTWKVITDQHLSNPADAEASAFPAQASSAQIVEYDPTNVRFTATIDLSSYSDGEAVSIYIGRKTLDDKIVCIFTFEPIIVGDEIYVPDVHDECNNVSLNDSKNPMVIVSFDSILSQSGLGDRLRVKPISGGYDSIGNDQPSYTWNRIVRFYESDMTAGKIWNVEGWIGFSKAGYDHTNTTFSAEVYRDGVLVKTPSGISKSKDTNSGVAALVSANYGGMLDASCYTIYLGTEDLQDGDVVHLIMTATVDGVQTKYCFKHFTIKVVADSTDLTAGPFTN